MDKVDSKVIAVKKERGRLVVFVFNLDKATSERVEYF
jgi:hypothetical protein